MEYIILYLFFGVLYTWISETIIQMWNFTKWLKEENTNYFIVILWKIFTVILWLPIIIFSKKFIG